MRIEFDPTAMTRLDPADDHSLPAAGQRCNVVMTDGDGKAIAAFIDHEWDEYCGDWIRLLGEWMPERQWICNNSSPSALINAADVDFYWEPSE